MGPAGLLHIAGWWDRTHPHKHFGKQTYTKTASTFSCTLAKTMYLTKQRIPSAAHVKYIYCDISYKGVWLYWDILYPSTGLSTLWNLNIRFPLTWLQIAVEVADGHDETAQTQGKHHPIHFGFPHPESLEPTIPAKRDSLSWPSGPGCLFDHRQEHRSG